jgi:hypothetical protein
MTDRNSLAYFATATKKKTFDIDDSNAECLTVVYYSKKSFMLHAQETGNTLLKEAKHTAYFCQQGPIL